MKYFAISDVGKRKNTNDDMVYAAEPVPGKDQGVFIVCRGAGPKGTPTVANTITCHTIGPKLIDWLQGEGSSASYPGGESALRNAVQEANSAIRAEVKSRYDYIGMSSSFALVLVLGIKEDDEPVAHTLVSNLGDCCIYAIGKKITRLTEEHTLARESANHHPIDGVDAKRRIGISKYLGVDDTIDIPIHRVSLRKHIKLLLCSPGVTLHLSEVEIHNLVRNDDDPSSACRQIIKACMDKGGVDNISAIVVQREDFIPAKES